MTRVKHDKRFNKTNSLLYYNIANKNKISAKQRRYYYEMFVSRTD